MTDISHTALQNKITIALLNIRDKNINDPNFNQHLVSEAEAVLPLYPNKQIKNEIVTLSKQKFQTANLPGKYLLDFLCLRCGGGRLLQNITTVAALIAVTWGLLSNTNKMKTWS